MLLVISQRMSTEIYFSVTMLQWVCFSLYILISGRQLFQRFYLSLHSYIELCKRSSLLAHQEKARHVLVRLPESD